MGDGADGTAEVEIDSRVVGSGEGKYTEHDTIQCKQVEGKDRIG